MQYDVQVDRLKLRELRILLVVTQAGSMARAAKAVCNLPTRRFKGNRRYGAHPWGAPLRP